MTVYAPDSTHAAINTFIPIRVDGPLPEALRRASKYKASSIPRASLAAQTVLSTGVELLTLVPCQPGQTITKVDVKRAVDGVGTTNFWHAVRNSNRGLLAVTDDLGAAAVPANSTRTLASTVTVPADGVLLVGTVWVGSGTAPTLYGVSGNATVNTDTPRTTFTAGSGLTDPASAPATAETGTSSANTAWVGLQ